MIDRGYWSQVGRSGAGDIARFGSQRSSAVRTDPKTNGGERAEVSCRFGYDGKSPGLPCDVDLRFALARGDRALYTYGVWEHKPGSPAFSVGEARTAHKLNPKVFDYLYIDDRRHELLPSGKDWDAGEQLNMKEVRRIKTGPLAGRVEHKYDYSAILADTPAYGWCGTRDRVGCWLINPSIEYLAGGPTKVELTAHLDVNPGARPDPAQHVARQPLRRQLARGRPAGGVDQGDRPVPPLLQPRRLAGRDVEGRDRAGQGRAGGVAVPTG